MFFLLVWNVYPRCTELKYTFRCTQVYIQVSPDIHQVYSGVHSCELRCTFSWAQVYIQVSPGVHSGELRCTFKWAQVYMSCDKYIDCLCSPKHLPKYRPLSSPASSFMPHHAHSSPTHPQPQGQLLFFNTTNQLCLFLDFTSTESYSMCDCVRLFKSIVLLRFICVVYIHNLFFFIVG